jgi:hypothetical protein
VNNLLSPTRKSGHLTCAWVLTGNAKSPLACLWMEVDPSNTSSARDRSYIEAEEMQRWTVPVQEW